MSHPDPNGAPDLTPIRIGEVWDNPVTGELATILELPHQSPDGRATAELTARSGARVAAEHLHPKLVERFTVLEGELTVKRDGRTTEMRHLKRISPSTETRLARALQPVDEKLQGRRAGHLDEKGV